MYYRQRVSGKRYEQSCHNRLRDRTVILRIGVNPLVPAFCLKLSAEDSRPLLHPRLNDLEQIVGLLRSETSLKILVPQERQCHLGIG